MLILSKPLRSICTRCDRAKWLGSNFAKFFVAILFAAFISGQSIATGQDTEQPAELRSDLPTYGFDTPHVQEWLVLGPIPWADQPGQEEQSAPPEPPQIILDSLRTNKPIEIAGKEYSWHSIAAGNFGKVDVEAYCQGLSLKSANVTCYAACRMRSDSGAPRTYMFGADDEVRVWIGDNKPAEILGPNWFIWSALTKPLSIPADRETICLVAARNIGGSFSFSVSCGRDIEGVVNHWDGVTPLGTIGLELVDSAGKLLARQVTHENGKFRMKPVPYEGDSQIRVAAPEFKVKHFKDDEGGEFVIAQALEPTPVVRRSLRPRTRMTQTAITALCQDSLGNIYFANSGDDRIHQLSGGKKRSTAPFDTSGLGNVSWIHVDDTGRMLLFSNPCGLVVYNPSAVSFCYGANTLADFKQAADSVERVSCATEAPDGTFWLGVTRKNNDDAANPNESSSETYELHHVSANGDLLKSMPVAKEVVSVVLTENRLFAAAQYGEIHQLTLGEYELARVPRVPNTHICHLLILPNGQLQIVGGSSTFTQQADGSWLEHAIHRKVSYPYTTSVVTEQPSSELPYSQYVVHRASLYRLSHGNWISVSPPKKITCLAKSITGGVLCGTSDGMIEEFSLRTYDVWTTKNGLSSASASKVAVSGTSLLRGSLGAAPDLIFPDKTTRRIEVNLPGLPFVRADGSLLFMSSLASHAGLNVTRAPHFYVTPEGTARSIPPIGSQHHIINSVVETSGGRLIVATNLGLFELNDQLRLEPLSDESGAQVLSEVDVSVVWEAPDGLLWAACAYVGVGTIDLVTGQFELRVPLADYRVQSIASLDDDRLLVGTSRGAYTVNVEKNRIEPFAAETLADEFVQEVLTGPDRATYVACQSGRILRFKDDCLLTLVDIPEIATTNVWDIDFAPDGALLVATTQGLVRYHSQKRTPHFWITSVDAPHLKKTVSDLRWDISTSGSEPPTYEIEEGEDVSVSVGGWYPGAIAAYRYREEGKSWQYVNGTSPNLSFELSGLTPRNLEVQAIDRDHNYSAIRTLNFTPYLPWYRWRSTQAAALLFLLAGLGTIVTLRIGASKAHQRQIQAERIAREIAEENVAERERLLHRVSHDLRNPLFVIAGCAEMMEAGQLDQDAALPILNETVDSMTYLARQLLSYSRAKSAKRPSESKPTSVRKLLQSIRDEAYVTTRGDKVDFHIELAKSAPTGIKVPAQLLKEILHNLTSNAIKNTSEGQIVIHFGLVDGKPTFRVADSGCGMSQETIDNLFKPFFKQQSSAPSSGFGLGLTICKSLADEIPADLSVESELGRGTVVTLALSESTLDHDGIEVDDDKTAESNRQAGASMVPRDPDASRPIPNRVHGVLVDDLRFVRDVLDRRLATINVSVYECTSTSLPDLAKLQPKFLLTDLEMPVSSGFDLARRVKQSHPEIIVIAISEREDLLAKARDCPDFDCVLTKVSLLTNAKETMDFFRQFADPQDQGPSIPPPHQRLAATPPQG